VALALPLASVVAAAPKKPAPKQAAVATKEDDKGDEDQDDKDVVMVPVAERRCGFSFGLLAGAMIGGAEGYPNDLLKIDRDEFRSETGVAGGGQPGLWVGIALTDWIVIGLGGHLGRMVSSEHETDFWGGYFHVDAFPLYGLGGVGKELGFTLDAGVALSTTRLVETDVDVIESGGASRVNVGAFYEGIRLWKLSMGPFASFDGVFSPSAFRPSAWVGWRTAFYLGP
jgi:hypothetical protein